MIINLKKTGKTAAAVLFFSAAAVSAEIYLSSMSVPLSAYAETFDGQTSSRFRISSAEDEFSIPAAVNQRVVKEKLISGGKYIEIECGGFGNKNLRSPKPSETAETRFLNISSKEILSAAHKFKNSKNQPADVEEFVYRHISDKRYGIPLIPADAIYRERAGDCTEHAVLAAAILRAVKIPARAVIGMVFEKNFSGAANVFVFHMWVEAYSGGRWILIDATRPGKKKLNYYIALAYHSLKTDAPIDYLSAVSAISGMKIEYLSGR